MHVKKNDEENQQFTSHFAAGDPLKEEDVRDLQGIMALFATDRHVMYFAANNIWLFLGENKHYGLTH